MAAKIRSLLSKRANVWVVTEPLNIGPPLQPQEPLKPELTIAEAETARILAAARAQAEAIVNQAQVEAERIKQSALAAKAALEKEMREQGYQAGFAQGLAAGEAQGLEKTAQVLAQAKEVLAAALAEKEIILSQVEPQMLDLVFAIAKVVIGHEVTLDPGVVIEAIRKALKHVRGQEHIIIKVNLEDLEIARTARSELLKITESVREIEFRDDPKVEPGGCVIETGFGTIDARLSTQLEELAKAFHASTREEETNG